MRDLGQVVAKPAGRIREGDETAWDMCAGYQTGAPRKLQGVRAGGWTGAGLWRNDLNWVSRPAASRYLSNHACMGSDGGDFVGHA